MVTGSKIDYEALQQDALRGIVRAALQQIAKTGLPGEHHFYVSFSTQAPGAILSKRLKEKYPTEMTIVLQHRFWDLIVSEERFEVKLSFDGVPERLVVPFSAIKVFIDPSVHFGLQFDEPGEKTSAQPRRTMTMDAAYEQLGETRPDTPRAALSKRPRSPRKTKLEKDANDQKTRPATEPPQPEPASAAAPNTSTAAAEQIENGEVATAPADEAGAKIVSLDAFRKK